MKYKIMLMASLFACSICMDKKDAKEQVKEPEFIALESRDTIVEDLTIPDNGDIFGWATYRMKDVDRNDLQDYIVSTNYPPEPKDSQKQ